MSKILARLSNQDEFSKKSETIVPNKPIANDIVIENKAENSRNIVMSVVKSDEMQKFFVDNKCYATADQKTLGFWKLTCKTTNKATIHIVLSDKQYVTCGIKIEQSFSTVGELKLAIKQCRAEALHHEDLARFDRSL